MDDTNGWMPDTDVAALFGVSRRTLSHWRLHRRGPRYAKAGRSILYARTDVNAWLREQADARQTEASDGDR